MSRCPTCHKTFADLAKHWAASDCGKDMPVETAPAALSEVNDPLHLFECRFAHRVVADYNHLRFDKFIKASVCDAWHLLAVSWINELKSVAAEEAQKASSVAESVQAFGSVFDRGLQVLHKYQSEAARDRHNKTVLKAPYLEPKPFTVDASKAEFHKLATRFSLTELLGRVMQNDASARKQIIDASNEWKQGLKHMQRAKVYTDITDGWKARSSPMMRKATEAESNHVRMLIQLHNDDATYTNPIGTKKALHKYSITSGAIANLPIRMRLDFAYMLLLSIVQAGLLKDNDGLAWSMAGVNRSGKEVVPDSLAAEFRNLERGVPMKIPNDDDPLGEPLEIVLVAYFVVVSADWLAAQACGFTPESTSANMPCGECEWISFAAQRRGVAAAAPRARTHARLQETATHLLKGNLSKTALAEKLKSAGINKLVCALQPNHFPGADSVLDTPPDVMHLFGCGLSRIEPCWMMRILFKEGAKLAVDDPWVKLNQNIETLNRTLPRGKRLPKLYPPRTGKKLKEMHLDLNASETFLFTMQSITLLEPLLTADGKGHPAWRSWLAHRAIVSKCLQHVITDEEGDELDQLIKRHEEAFDKVVDYKDLERPKNHFMTHLSAALRRFGPFRCFWCMPWEAFLQVCLSSHGLPLTDCRLLTAAHRVPTAAHRVPTADCRSPIADCRSPIADRRL